MRLIDADALKIAFEEDGHLSAYIEEYIDDAPAVDAVPVVRCKECKYARRYDPRYVTCLCHPTFIHYSPVDGFCYLGKRKEDDHEAD